MQVIGSSMRRNDWNSSRSGAATRDGEGGLRGHMREWASVVREVAGVEDLNPSVLLAVEGCDDRAGLARLAAELERHVRIIEPETQVILMCSAEGRRRAAGGDGECLDIEDTAHAHAAFAVVIRFQVALIPGDTERRLGKLGYKQIVAGIGRQPFDMDGQLVVQIAARDGCRATRVWQACRNTRRRHKIKRKTRMLGIQISGWTA